MSDRTVEEIRKQNEGVVPEEDSMPALEQAEEETADELETVDESDVGDTPQVQKKRKRNKENGPTIRLGSKIFAFVLLYPMDSTEVEPLYKAALAYAVPGGELGNGATQTLALLRASEDRIAEISALMRTYENYVLLKNHRAFNLASLLYIKCCVFEGFEEVPLGSLGDEWKVIPSVKSVTCQFMMRKLLEVVAADLAMSEDFRKDFIKKAKKPIPSTVSSQRYAKLSDDAKLASIVKNDARAFERVFIMLMEYLGTSFTEKKWMDSMRNEGYIPVRPTAEKTKAKTTRETVAGAAVAFWEIAKTDTSGKVPKVKSLASFAARDEPPVNAAPTPKPNKRKGKPSKLSPEAKKKKMSDDGEDDSGTLLPSSEAIAETFRTLGIVKNEDGTTAPVLFRNIPEGQPGSSFSMPIDFCSNETAEETSAALEMHRERAKNIPVLEKQPPLDNSLPAIDGPSKRLRRLGNKLYRSIDVAYPAEMFETIERKLGVLHQYLEKFASVDVLFPTRIVYFGMQYYLEYEVDDNMDFQSVASMIEPPETGDMSEEEAKEATTAHRNAMELFSSETSLRVFVLMFVLAIVGIKRRDLNKVYYNRATGRLYYLHIEEPDHCMERELITLFGLLDDQADENNIPEEERVEDLIEDPINSAVQTKEEIESTLHEFTILEGCEFLFTDRIDAFDRKEAEEAERAMSKVRKAIFRRGLDAMNASLKTEGRVQLLVDLVFDIMDKLGVKYSDYDAPIEDEVCFWSLQDYDYVTAEAAKNMTLEEQEQIDNGSEKLAIRDQHRVKMVLSYVLTEILQFTEDDEVKGEEEETEDETDNTTMEH